MTSSTLSATQKYEKKRYGLAIGGILFGLLAGITWGADGVLLGFILEMDPLKGGALLAAPLAATVLHDGFAGLAMAFYSLITGRWKEHARTIRTKPGLIVCLAALFGGPIAMGGFLVAISMCGAAYALGIIATYPVMGAILARVILKEKINARVFIGILISVCGAILISYTPPDQTTLPHFYLGIGIAFFSAFGYAMEGVLATYGLDMVDPVVAITLREAVACFVNLVLVLPLVGGLAVLGQTLTTPNTLGLLALVGVIGGTSFLVWYKAFSMCGCARSMAMNITYALWGLVFTALFTDFDITMPLVAGAITITLGAMLVVGNPKEIFNLRAEG